jgi:hypothetical protein
MPHTQYLIIGMSGSFTHPTLGLPLLTNHMIVIACQMVDYINLIQSGT